MRRFAALAVWCLLVWVLLTWTATIEQVAFGVGVSVVVAVLIAPLGDVAPPWRIVSARRLWALVRLGGYLVVQIARANAVLAWRVWHRRPPIRTGLVIVPTTMRSDAGLTVVGLLSSLVVDNQIVDVDRLRHELVYHAVAVPPRGKQAAYDSINGGLEKRLVGLTR